MGTTASQRDSVCVLTIDGELTYANVAEFRNLVESAPGGFAEDGRDFVVGFVEATAIDSAGLEALTRLKRDCDERLGLVKLCNLPDTMKKILEMTRLDRMFEQYEFTEEALGSFG